MSKDKLQETLPEFEEQIKRANKQLSAPKRRLLDTAELIASEAPEHADFLHSVLCQVGMPRSRQPGRIFKRENGLLGVTLEAGSMWDGQKFVEQPLPYGTKPRLVMIHISSEAVRTQNRDIEIGNSINDFLHTLGMGNSGGRNGPFTRFKNQMYALAASRMTIGMTHPGASKSLVKTVNTQPIEEFDAWLHNTSDQKTFWPGSLKLSEPFFNTMIEHAVPLDKRALGSLANSAFALDVYTWLAHRLCRIENPKGIKLSWENLHEQFGQEYASRKDFKKQMVIALRTAYAVYPDAKVHDEIGGIRLMPSPPPIPKKMITVKKKR